MSNADRIRSEGAPCVGGGYYFVRTVMEKDEEFIEYMSEPDSYGNRHFHKKLPNGGIGLYIQLAGSTEKTFVGEIDMDGARKYRMSRMIANEN